MMKVFFGSNRKVGLALVQDMVLGWLAPSAPAALNCAFPLMFLTFIVTTCFNCLSLYESCMMISYLTTIIFGYSWHVHQIYNVKHVSQKENLARLVRLRAALKKLKKSQKRLNSTRRLKGTISRKKYLALLEAHDLMMHRRWRRLKRRLYQQIQEVEIGDKLDAQSGMEPLLQTFERLASIRNVSLPDQVLRRIEGLISLCVALRECNSTAQFMSIVSLYLQTWTNSSLVETALSTIKELVESSEYDTQSATGLEETPQWLQLLKRSHTNWHLAVQNEGFGKVSKLMSMIVGMGLCEASNLEFTIKGFKIFQVAAYPKQCNAVDLIDAFFSTVTFFVEGGYECIRTQSMDPLLYGNQDVQNFEDLYAKCEKGAQLARAGNLEKLMNIDNSQLECMFINALALVRDMIAKSTNPILKRMLMDKQEKLRRMQTSFQETRIQGGLREAPFALGFFGGSGVGKSSIANVMMVLLLAKNGFECTDDKIITLNEHDKFMSTYRSYINGIFIDDIGNTKAEFVEKAPTAKLIELINNVRAYANVAEADMKGKVSIEPRVVITTKNVKDACAHTYSNEPASIARREKMVITVNVRPEFATDGMLDPSKVELNYDLAYPYDNVIPDVWTCTVEQAFPIPNKTRGKPATIGWKTLSNKDGKLMQDVGIEDIVKLSYELSEDHFRQQKDLVAKQNNIGKQINFCEKCRAPYVFCSCPEFLEEFSDSQEEEQQEDDEEFYDAQAGALPLFILGRYARYKLSFLSKFATHYESFEKWSIEKLIERLTWLETSRWCQWTNYIPSDWLGCDFVISMVYATHAKDLRARIRASYAFFLLVALYFSYLTFAYHKVFLLGVITCLSYLHCVVNIEKEKIYRMVLKDNQAMPTFFKKHRDEYVKYFTAACAVAGGLYILAEIWKASNVVHVPQGNLQPKTYEDMLKRDGDASELEKIAVEHNWTTVEVEDLPHTTKSKCTTPDHLSNLVFKNTCWMRVDGRGANSGCDAFFPCSNVAIIPNHVWKDDSQLLCHFHRDTPDQVGTTFKSYISKHQSIHIPDTDLCLIWVPNGGDWKDLTDYLPLRMEPNCPARLIHKTPDGTRKEGKVGLKYSEVKSIACRFQGYLYDVPFDTFPGLCMSSLVTETKYPVIAGFHLAGKNGLKHGAGGVMTQSQLKLAIDKLRRIPGVIVCKSSGDLDGTTYDMQWFQGPTIHEKSPTRKLGKDTNVKVYGSVTGRATYSSEVVNTVITDAVYDVTGIPNKHGKPKFRKGDPFETSLQHSARPSHGVEPNLLVKAVEDYIKPLIALVKSIPELAKNTNPLTDMEVVAGCDGKRFVDKMPPNTSVGFPLSGAKKKYLTMLDPEDYPSHNCPVELDAMFVAEVKRMEEAYLAGVRCYPVFKACLKDEPTLMTKDKVRVFQCSPIALQMLTRKYFLPIARILSLVPLESECSVGVNPYGWEWDQLSEFITKYGSDRILAGDYSKYDLRMPAQVMFAAFRIMIDIARECGYSERDITIMEGIATDICYPLMAYNGDLIQHYGSNPSGQNLTVYVNSIVNSLLFRCAYYDIYKGKKVPEFRDVCALQTYGDDAKSSVKKGYDDFNHISVADFLQRHDMKFTMPDKTSTPVPYMKDKDADFLKRHNVYNEDLGCTMGALDEESIFKSLHSVLKSKSITPEQQAMQNIDGAIREWFSHGEEVYEKRRSQMQEVADRCDISHGCNMLYKSYEELKQEWIKRYPQEDGGDRTYKWVQPTPEEDVEYDTQSGEYPGDDVIFRIRDPAYMALIDQALIELALDIEPDEFEIPESFGIFLQRFDELGRDRRHELLDEEVPEDVAYTDLMWEIVTDACVFFIEHAPAA